MTPSKTDRLKGNNAHRNSSKSSSPSCIITVPMGHSNSYLIVSGGRGVLVDGGCPGKIKNLQTALEKNNLGFPEKGRTPFPRGTIWFSKIVSYIGKILLISKSKYTSLSPEIAVREEYDLGKYIPSAKVIPTPGHTDGSISLVIGNEVAFVGDTLFSAIPGTVFPPFANNVPELLKSWEKLIAMRCRIFYPGHGKPRSLQKLKNSYEKKKDMYEKS